MARKSRYSSGVKKTEKKKTPISTVGKTRYSGGTDKKVTTEKRGATPTGGQGGSKSRYSAGGSLKISSSSTKQASKKGAVLINGKPPTAIQKRLLAGGWSAKELEAKINARKKKK